MAMAVAAALLGWPDSATAQFYRDYARQTQITSSKQILKTSEAEVLIVEPISEVTAQQEISWGDLSLLAMKLGMMDPLNDPESYDEYMDQLSRLADLQELVEHTKFCARSDASIWLEAAACQIVAWGDYDNACQVVGTECVPW